MSISAGDVVLGMNVYASDGEKIGSVNEVYNNPNPGGSAMASHLYMQVDEGWVLNVWADKLYIPFSTIVQIKPGWSLTIDCTKAEAEERYQGKPASLQ